ncbi:MAG: hypothetical protein HQL39_16095 [Alphaproteobacteria bacterium]|nr:hypothetical protein [Alphaproteobacteria bacterium]
MIDGVYAPLGGRIGQCFALSALTWHVALGRGDPAWDAADRADPLWQSALAPDAAQAMALVDEIGRRVADEVAFVTPDPAGEIVLPEGRWTRSASPTNHLYVQVFLDYGDGAAQTVREVGLFAGGVTLDTLPPGQRWFVAAELVEPGHLMQLLRYAVPIVRSPSVRPLFHFVQSF